MNKILYTEINIDSIKTSTNKAVLIVSENHEEYWIPRTLIRSKEEREILENVRYNSSEISTLPVATWFVDKEGLNG